jgi:DNA polymerase-3 subunit epsilon
VREVAHDRIAYFGGIPQVNVTKRTNLLVVGQIDPRTLSPGAKVTGKMKDALELRAKGQQLEIMAGFDFLPVLD